MHSENEEDENSQKFNQCPKMKTPRRLDTWACRYDCLICKDLDFLKQDNTTKKKNTQFSNIAAQDKRISLRVVYETIKDTVKGYSHIYSTMVQYLRDNDLTDHWLEIHMRRDPSCMNHLETSIDYIDTLMKHDDLISKEDQM